MNLTERIGGLQGPHFYLQMGELVSSTGDDAFATRMFDLIEPLVPFAWLELSEWTLDERYASAVQIKPLGQAGHEPPAPPGQQHEQALMNKMLDMDDSLLIQLRVPLHSPANTTGQAPQASAHQCHLVSRSASRRWVISLHRSPVQRLFTLPELSFLKNLSDSLLPLIERHAQASRKSVAHKAGPLAAQPSALPLQQVFSERLARVEISLSAREQEVCLGLLTGGTVPQLARQLQVKNSSIETYLKRAAAKLGVSGRHGLARWMAGA